MIINEILKNNLLNLRQNIDLLIKSNSLTDLQIENFLRDFEKARYKMLSEIKLYNKTVEFEYQKLKTIDNEYKAQLIDNVLRIYVPEVLPSYKNLKTHTHKRILLNVLEATKPFANTFNNEVFIYVKVFDNILGWDIDNKYVKPIADALVYSNVIKDDNITKMFYCVKGEYSELPHTEIYVCDSNEINNFLKIYSSKQYRNFANF